MTDNEMELIMRALDDHRDFMSHRFDDLATEVRAEVRSRSEVIDAHQKRFEAFDVMVSASKKVGAALVAIIGAVWAVFTYWGGK